MVPVDVGIGCFADGALSRCLSACSESASAQDCRKALCQGDYEIDVETYELKEGGLPKSVELRCST